MECLGCRAFLIENEILQEESLTVEMKNYTFPITSLKIKRILRSTINSLVNTRGGAIYLSVDDATGCVVGLPLTRKEQDLYRMSIEDLVREFTPSLPLAKECIRTLFLPVLSQAQHFTGKYVPKVVVQQGDPAQLYSFIDRVVLEEGRDRTEYEVIYAYERHPTKVKRLNPHEIIQEACKRVLERPASYAVHEGCHPPVLEVKVEPRQTIRFEFP
jgi:hypothetical protein